MRFFEVNTQAPPSVDMGGHLPLRFIWRPLLGDVVYAVLIGTWFCVIPAAYVLDQGLSFTAVLENWWFSIVFFLGGLFSVAGTLSCILTRLEVEVTSSQVRQSGGGALRDKTWNEPLAHYTALRVERRHHPDWIGAKDEFGIHLCHAEDASRSVLLYWGRSERRFQARLSRYSKLLGLGVQGALAARRATG
ncbi:hypothetical protein [Pyxidicoccus sp. MSG2]|uniref:hypothetical protein n=1 Tax=Pyxidicoccus sp. MSG2 TaxID=2996790 RepID=UPI002270C940|nr:hypothetical protein [Pyxidicoccus sp. MSG2]MCY1015575.1 hypothetical protein [Pyxidicoccus sp. MSG2]